MKKIVVLPGGFHPFHAGHLALYQQALSKFPDADVYMAASDNQKERPFPFKVKQLLATEVAGIPKNKFVQVGGSPFNPDIITKNYNSSEDALIFVRSEKDRKEHPLPDQIRKKDGKMGYLLSYPGKDERLKPFADHGYIDYLPVAEFSGGMTSATEIRNAWPKLDELGKIELIKGMYPGAEMTVPKIKKISQILDSVLIGELVESFVDPDQSKQYWNHDDQNVGVGMMIDMPLTDKPNLNGRRQGFNEGEERSIIRDAAINALVNAFEGLADEFESREAIEANIYNELSNLNVEDIVDPEMDHHGQRMGNFASGRVIDVVDSGSIIDEVLQQINYFDPADDRNHVSESLNKIRGMIKETTDEQKSKSVHLHRKLFELMEEEKKNNVVKLRGFGREVDKPIPDLNRVRAEKEKEQERENNYYSERRAEQEELLARLQAELLNAKQEFSELADAQLLPIEMIETMENIDKLIDFIENWEGSEAQNNFPFTESILEKLQLKTVQLKEYFGGMRDTSAPRVLRKQTPKLSPKAFWNTIDLSETADYIEEK
jgi:hypothetical protein